jgi:ABC-type branched-subunit amino acid transport system permease subunit
MGAVVFQAIQLVGTVLLPGTWKLLLGATLIIVILVAPAGITGVLPIKSWSKPRERKLTLRPVAEKS